MHGVKAFEPGKPGIKIILTLKGSAAGALLSSVSMDTNAARYRTVTLLRQLGV